MRIWWAVMVGVASVALGGAASGELVQGQVTTIGHPMLTVTGEATVEAVPDTVRITASVVTEGETVAQARERNAQIAQRAMAAVEELNLANATVKTANYTMERVTRDARFTLSADQAKLDIPWSVAKLDIKESQFWIDVPTTLGYRARNSVVVKIEGGTGDKLSDAAGKVIDALMAAGGNEITSVDYSLDKDDRPARREALAKAVKDAQMTAEVVAAAAGRSIVGIRSISPSYMRPQLEMRNVQAFFAGDYERAGAETPTSVTAGMLELTATVQINFELDYNPGDTEFLRSRGQ